MKMYLVKFYNREEFDNMKISDSIEKLKDFARSEYEGCTFATISGSIFISDDTGYVVGVIGEIEYI